MTAEQTTAPATRPTTLPTPLPTPRPTTRPTTRDWLSLTSWRAFDVDADGRVLAGHDGTGTGTVQLVEIDPAAAADAAPVVLTALPGVVSGRYLPGERAVVVVHDDGGDENGQLSLLRLDGSAAPPLPARLDDLEPVVRAQDVVHRLLDVRPGRVYYASNARNGVDFDVCVNEVHGGVNEVHGGVNEVHGGVHEVHGGVNEAGRVTDRVLYSGGGHVEAVAVAPDGERLVLTVSSAAAMSSHLVLVDAGGDSTGTDGCVTRMTDPQEPGRIHRVAWDADGSCLFATTEAETDTTLVSRFDLRRGRWRPLVAHDGWDVSGWPSPDGLQLLAETLVDGESRLALHDAATGTVLHAVDLPGAGTHAAGSVAYASTDPVWSPDSRFVALSFTAPAVPGEVLLLDVATGAVHALTSSAAAVEGWPVVLPSSHRVPTQDGERVPCFLFSAADVPAHLPAGDLPADDLPAGDLPAGDLPADDLPADDLPADGSRPGSSVLVVHGGPEGQSVRRFDPLVQALAAAGHAVLVPNVRGSTGYGRRWYSLDDGPLRLDSVADLAALHDWLPTLGLDPARSALWGQSYGGYMVLAGLAFQPQLWAAGVDIVGISSLVTFLENTSAYRRAVREREYGRLSTDRDLLQAASPLQRIDQVRAPVFVVHGANDPRVPLSEAEQLVAAVRAREVECELRVYGDEGHGLAKLPNRLDAYPAAVDFLTRHLRTRPQDL